MSDILDDILNDGEQPDRATPANNPANDANAPTGNDPHNQTVSDEEPELQVASDDVVEAAGLPEGVKVIDDMGNYETKGNF
jgi:hypothetical protein